MTVDNTRIIGGGQFKYTLNDTTKVVTWTVPMRPTTGGAFTRLVNVTQALGLAIVSHTFNAAGHILTTTYTGDASSWLATDGLAHMIDDNLPGGLFTTTPLAIVGQVANTQYTWTEKITDGQRFERSATTFVIHINKDGQEWGCDEVGVKHQFQFYSPTTSTTVLLVQASTGWVVRDLWMSFGTQNGFQWSGNLVGTDEGSFERCKFVATGTNISGSAGFIRNTGFDKKVTYRVCEFMFMGTDGGTTSPAFEMTNSGSSHQLIFKGCTFWRTGTLFGTQGAGMTVDLDDCIVFANRSEGSQASGTVTYTNCVGTIASGNPAGVTLKTEEECGLGYHNSPPSASKFAMDPASFSSEGAAIKDLGTAGLLVEDSLGNLYDVATPDIGPYEDHPTFGEVVTVPGRPIIT